MPGRRANRRSVQLAAPPVVPGGGSSADLNRSPSESRLGDSNNTEINKDKEASSVALVSAVQRNLQTTMGFVAELTTACAKAPNATIEDLLEDLGFVRGKAIAVGWL